MKYLYQSISIAFNPVGADCGVTCQRDVNVTELSSDTPISKNRRLKAFLGSLKDNLNTAQNTDDLVAMVERAKAFGTPLKFDNRIPHQLAFALYALTVGVGLYLYSIDGDFLMALLPFFGGIGFSVMAGLRNAKASNLSDDMFKRDILFDNQMTAITEGLAHQTQSLIRTFTDFRRGNHKREVKELIRGTFSGEEHSFIYHYFHFHYVDQYETGIGSKRRTVYDHHDRYGILVQFDFTQNMAIQSFGRLRNWNATFRTASNRFNKLYDVEAALEVDAAKFLKPKVVVAFEDFYQNFGKPNFEFTSTGELCMSFNDKGLVQVGHSYSLNEPDLFIEELRQANDLPKLKIALEHIHTLMKYSDSNF